MFNYDWFHGIALQEQREEACWRCALSHFADLERDQAESNPDFVQFRSELEVRALIYLRDGFSYEVKDIAEVESRTHLTFECEPVDDQYKVGAFVVTVPFEEIVRVEVFAVHPSEKPGDLPQITGFRSQPERPERIERSERVERSERPELSKRAEHKPVGAIGGLSASARPQ